MIFFDDPDVEPLSPPSPEVLAEFVAKIKDRMVTVHMSPAVSFSYIKYANDIDKEVE